MEAADVIEAAAAERAIEALVLAEMIEEAATQEALDALVAAEANVRPLLDDRDYTRALQALAALREPVDMRLE